MKVKMLSIARADSAALKKAQQMICETVPELRADESAYEVFTMPKSFFGALAACLPQYEVIITAAGSDVFLDQKWKLLKALGLSGEINQRVAETVGNIGDAATKAHALMPKNADIFLTESGLYSGFAVKKGKQTLILLPLDRDILDEILSKYLVPYLGITETADTDVASEEQPTPKAEKPQKNIAEIAARRLAQKGVTVSLAQTQTNIFACKRIQALEKNSDVFSFEECGDEKNEGESLRNYAARISDAVRIKSGTKVGAIISNVYSSDGNNAFTFVAVSDSDHAHVRKIFANDGESVNDLVEASTKTLFRMLREYAETGGIPPEGAEVIPSEAPSDLAEDTEIDSSNRKGTAAKIIVGVVIAIILCVLIGFFFRDEVMALFADSESEITTEYAQAQESTVDAFLMLDIDESTEEYSEEMSVSETETLTEEAETETEAETSTEKESTTVREAPSVSQLALTTTKKVVETTTTKKVTTTTTTTTVKATEKVASDDDETTEKSTTKTTTAKETTTEKTTTKAVAQETAVDGVFKFTAYGYGHGVGMSQTGALVYGNSEGSYNWKYSKILSHYYPGTTLTKDNDIPLFVKFGGSLINTRDFLARVTNAEIGGSCKTATIEGCKAQVVAIYTYVKRYNGSNIPSNQLAYKTSTPSDVIYAAVDAVYGEYLTYNGAAAFTPFSSGTAGKSSSCTSAWGGSYPYLMGGVTSPETVSVRSYTMTSEQLRAAVDEYNETASDSKKITLSDDPSEWIKVISHDSAVSSDVGYVSRMRLGNREMTGNAFRAIVGTANLRSHCFSYAYTSN